MAMSSHNMDCLNKLQRQMCDDVVRDCFIGVIHPTNPSLVVDNPLLDILMWLWQLEGRVLLISPGQGRIELGFPFLLTNTTLQLIAV